MEQLKSELTLALGETISRLEMISEHPPTRLYALYDRDGRPMPVVAKYFRHQGRAAMEARKLALLGQAGLIAVPAVYGLVMSQQPPVHEMLLLARLNGVTAEAPARVRTGGRGSAGLAPARQPWPGRYGGQHAAERLARLVCTTG